MKVKDIINIPRPNQLNEMANDRKIVIRKITERKQQLNEHLVKYFYYTDNSNKHWLTEIEAHLKFISKQKSAHNNGFLSKKSYNEILFCGENNIDAKKSLVDEYISTFLNNPQPMIKSGLTVEAITDCMNSFYNWICEVFEKGTYQKTEAKDTSIIEKALDKLKNKKVFTKIKIDDIIIFKLTKRKNK